MGKPTTASTIEKSTRSSKSTTTTTDADKSASISTSISTPLPGASDSNKSNDNGNGSDKLNGNDPTTTSKDIVQDSTYSDSDDITFDDNTATFTSHTVQKQQPSGKTKKGKKRKSGKKQLKDLMTASSITIKSDSDNEQNVTSRPFQSSSVWKYAKRSDDKSYALCSICDKSISTSNWSTTYLRRHLIEKHNKTELIIPNEQKKIVPLTVTKNLKERLDKLSIEAIIRDSLPFNALQKPGVLKLIQEAVPGEIKDKAEFLR